MSSGGDRPDHGDPGVPLTALVALLFVVTLFGAPFYSARAAIFPDVLGGDMYVMGTAVTVTTYQFAQVIGFAVGGTLVAFFGTRISLVIDAATFAASALIVRAWVQARPAAVAAPTTIIAAGRHLHRGPARAGAPGPAHADALRSAGRVLQRPRGRGGPPRRALGGGAAAVGVILAANALGQTVGTITFSRFVAPATRLRFMGPLAISACGVLVLFFWKPDLYVSLLILFTSGLCACYQLAANSSFVSAAPQEQRSQAFGLAQGAMSLGQGVVMILAGAAAEHHAPARAIAVCGAVGVVAAFAVTVGAARDRGGSAGKRHQRALGQVQLLSRMAGSFPCGRGVVRVRVRSSCCRAWRAPFRGPGAWCGSGSGPVVVAHGGLLSVRPGGWCGSGSGPVVVAHGGLLSVRPGAWCGSGSGPVVVAHSGLLSVLVMVGERGFGLEQISAGCEHACRNISLCTHLNPLSD